VTLTRAEYKERATEYYMRRLAHRGNAEMFFRVVQAGIMAIAPGRQKSATRGWTEACLAAHRRAAAALR